MEKIPKKLTKGPWGRLLFLVYFILFLFTGVYTGKSQNITGFEYFFDTDPGFGMGIPVNVAPAPLIDNLNVNLDITGLSPGFHSLNFRAADDSGKWSLTNITIFYKQVMAIPLPNVIAGEYFFDIDPGFGNGISIPLTPGTNLENISFAADITSLSTGIHFLHARVKDVNGRWSLVQSTTFVKTPLLPGIPDIVAAEYFFDTDPGFSNGTSIPLSPGIIIDNLDFIIDITSLSPGFHKLHVRVKDDAGKWSLASTRTFNKEAFPLTLPSLSQVEYFFDTDPGFGNAIAVPFTPDTNITVNVIIGLENITPGFHNLYIRAKDTTGKWSLSSCRPFYKEAFVPGLPKITKVEYFFDMDPGFGNATNVPIAPGVNKTVSWSMNINSLQPGFHNLFVRVKDSTGKWSLTSTRPFYKDFIPVQLPNITEIEYFIDTDPGFGNAVEVGFTQDTNNLNLTFDIDIDTFSQGFHQLFIRTKDSQGRWSHTSVRPFVKQINYDTLPDLVQIEYFFDTDPGFGNAIQVPVIPMQNIPFQTWALDLSSVSFGQHMLHIRTMDEYGKWSLAARDTIFYYLDSLPTASMSGPIGVCINSSIELEITLTGTPPWTLIYNTGEEVDTVAGIMLTPYTFMVSPSFSGPHTAQVLKVQDTYYTGLYTGIPIEYQVYPLPEAAGTLYGPDNLCQGTGSVWFWVYPVPNATAYNWSVPAGASLVSGLNTSSILVNFSNVTASGMVSVTPINACGQGQAASKTVILHDNPVVDAGEPLFLPFQGADTLFPTVTGGSEPYSFSWSPWYWFDNANLQNPVVSPSSTTSVSLQVVDIFGCSGSDQVMVYVGEPQGTIFSGNLLYDNSLNTPLTNSTVMLKQDGTTVASATTGSSGEYTITGIPAGYYDLSATSTKPWGGVNATDALLVLQDFTHIITLNGLKKQVADVNASGLDNAVDAMLIASRYVGFIQTFPLGDWFSESKYLYAAGVGSVTENLDILCVGDVDGSYIPEARTAPGVILLTEGALSAERGTVTEVPLLAGEYLEAGAVSLTLTLPLDLDILNIRTSRSISGTESISGNLLYHQTGRNLKIAWYSINPISINKGEPLFWITLKPGESTDEWIVESGSVVSNGMGQTLPEVTLVMPTLVFASNHFSLEANQPNPFTTSTLISFNLPEDGFVSLKVYNAVGQEIHTLTNEVMPEGRHQLLFDGSELSSGVYHYTLRFSGKEKQYRETRKMIVQK